jgi:hypothetical protein
MCGLNDCLQLARRDEAAGASGCTAAYCVPEAARSAAQTAVSISISRGTPHRLFCPDGGRLGNQLSLLCSILPPPSTAPPRPPNKVAYGVRNQ